MDTLTRTNYRVRFSEVKQDMQITPAEILYYFQDSNIFQHEDFGIGLDYLESEHKAWFCSSWHVYINRYAKLGERLDVGTWDAKYDGIYNYRNCEALDENNDRIAYGYCTCIYMDLIRQRPEKITDEIGAPYYHADPIDMDYSTRKIKLPDTYTEETPFEITLQNIDFNGHVNNGKYIELAQSYLPNTQAVKELQADYRTSAKLHDIFYPRITVTDDLCYIIQFCNNQGKPYSVIRFALDSSLL